jgi:hypothetical protein
MKINIKDWFDQDNLRPDAQQPFKIGDRTVSTNRNILISTKQFFGKFEDASELLNNIHFDIMHAFNGKVLRPLVIDDHYFTDQHEVYEIFGYQFDKRYIDLIGDQKGLKCVAIPYKYDQDCADLYFKCGDTFGAIAGLVRSERIKK